MPGWSITTPSDHTRVIVIRAGVRLRRLGCFYPRVLGMSPKSTYKEMLLKRFDRVFGNPPWGGVLKGPLAPVYDNLKKQRFAREYPESARGKYDIYGLFLERALQ